jgi:tRNA(His) guanylyltransferase
MKMELDGWLKPNGDLEQELNRIKNMKDALGDRMKDFYEDRFRIKLPRRSNVIMRIDGKAFHTYTRGLKKPFDEGLMEDMDETTKYLCENIQGAKIGYVQSDEISILITDYDELSTSAWFDYNIQKMCSIAASLATAKFNELRRERFVDQRGGFMRPPGLALFDARIMVIPYDEEVVNYFIWRQQDATRNSISMAAQSMYSHSELNGKKAADMQEMIFQKGVNWNDYPTRFKRGSAVIKVKEFFKRPKGSKAKGSKIDSTEFIRASREEFDVYERTKWQAVETPIFSQEKAFLKWKFSVE